MAQEIHLTKKDFKLEWFSGQGAQVKISEYVDENWKQWKQKAQRALAMLDNHI